MAVKDRQTTDRIALLEVKGSQLWGHGKEPAKADAVHPDYGKVFMVGRKRGDSEFVFLRRLALRWRATGRCQWIGCGGDNARTGSRLLIRREADAAPLASSLRPVLYFQA